MRRKYAVESLKLTLAEAMVSDIRHKPRWVRSAVDLARRQQHLDMGHVLTFLAQSLDGLDESQYLRQIRMLHSFMRDNPDAFYNFIQSHEYGAGAVTPSPPPASKQLSLFSDLDLARVICEPEDLRELKEELDPSHFRYALKLCVESMSPSSAKMLMSLEMNAETIYHGFNRLQMSRQNISVDTLAEQYVDNHLLTESGKRDFNSLADDRRPLAYELYKYEGYDPVSTLAIISLPDTVENIYSLLSYIDKRLESSGYPQEQSVDTLLRLYNDEQISESVAARLVEGPDTWKPRLNEQEREISRTTNLPAMSVREFEISMRLGIQVEEVRFFHPYSGPERDALIESYSCLRNLGQPPGKALDEVLREGR